MWIPKGYTEKTVLEEMKKVIDSIMRTANTFGYFNKEELRQQAYLFGVEALNTKKFDSQDGKRPLGGFLRTCIVNRIISLSRDRYSRQEPPCRRCPFSDPDKLKSESGCKAFQDKLDCDKFKAYYKRNLAKRNLMNLSSETPLFDVSVDYRPFVEIENKDYINILSKFLTSKSKKVLHNILAGKTVTDAQLDKLREEVSRVISSGKI